MAGNWHRACSYIIYNISGGKSMLKAALLIVSFLSVVLFQNCGKVQFKQTGSASSFEKPTGEVVVQNPDKVNEVLDKAPAGDSASDVPSSSNGSVVENETEVEHTKHGSNGSCKKSVKLDSSGQDYVCVLDGSGKSVKLSYIENQLKGKVGTENDLCMSKSACVTLVASKFKVKEAAFRGFCKNNSAHSIQMSDDQIKSLIEKL